MSQKKEFFNLTNTLACIPSISLNQNVLIILRNDCYVAGKVVSTDGFMNVCLENVVYCDQKGLQYELENYAVRFRQILYFIPQSSKSFTEEIEDYYKSLSKPKPSENKKRTFKAKRAMLKTQATVAENASKNK